MDYQLTIATSNLELIHLIALALGFVIATAAAFLANRKGWFEWDDETK